MNLVAEAYEFLNIPTSEQEEDLERRFQIWVRRTRLLHNSDTLTGREIEQLEMENKAYRLIFKEQQRKAANDYNNKKYGKFKKFSNAAEKIDHFVDYYKLHMIGSLVLMMIIAISFITYKQIKQEQAALALLPVTDLSLVIAGNYEMENTVGVPFSLEQRLLNLNPAWKRIDVKMFQTKDNPITRHDMAMKSQSEIGIWTEHTDVYVLDQRNFIKLLQAGYLKKIEDTYGIDVSGGSLAQALSILGKPMIAAVSISAKHPEQAKQFIEKFKNNHMQQ